MINSTVNLHNWFPTFCPRPFLPIIAFNQSILAEMPFSTKSNICLREYKKCLCVFYDTYTVSDVCVFNIRLSLQRVNKLKIL